MAAALAMLARDRNVDEKLMLPPAESYEELRAKFLWRVTASYNIGVDV